MEENKQATEAANTTTPNEPVQPISSEQAAEVAGGDGSCSTSTITVDGVSVTSSGTLSDVATGAYDAAVDLTSHVIERVVGTF
jgi:hypothetical protein